MPRTRLMVPPPLVGRIIASATNLCINQILDQSKTESSSREINKTSQTSDVLWRSQGGGTGGEVCRLRLRLVLYCAKLSCMVFGAPESRSRRRVSCRTAVIGRQLTTSFYCVVRKIKKPANESHRGPVPNRSEERRPAGPEQRYERARRLPDDGRR